jgi:hypothetical protein
MVHHYRFAITGDLRARFLKYLWSAAYAGCARVVDEGGLDWANWEDAEIIPHTQLMLDVATPSAGEASRIADRIGESLCLDEYELVCLGEQ